MHDHATEGEIWLVAYQLTSRHLHLEPFLRCRIAIRFLGRCESDDGFEMADQLVALLCKFFCAALSV